MNLLKSSILTLAALAGRLAHSSQIPGPATDVHTTPVGKEFVRVDTARYTLEVPKGWTVGKQTPWGARDIEPEAGPGRMGAMTAGPTQASWQDLYETSLFFIQREEPGKETPFRVAKTKQGYPCMSFEVCDKEGFAARRYTLLKNAKGSAVALSVKIPSRDAEKEFVRLFQHMVDTAKIKD